MGRDVFYTVGKYKFPATPNELATGNLYLIKGWKVLILCHNQEAIGLPLCHYQLCDFHQKYGEL